MTINKTWTEAVGDILTREKASLRPRISYDALSERTGISRRQLIRYLAGERSPSLAEVEAICEVFGLDPFRDVLAPANDKIKG